jgi:tRNA (guanine10-N2)-dimethyltransferase
MILLELSKEDLDLSREEALALAEQTNQLYDNYLLVNKSFDYERLAYTKRVFEVLFSCKENELKEKIKKYEFCFTGSFAVNKTGKSKLKIEELADLVWKQVKHPKVDLKNSKNRIFFVFTTKVFCCRLLWENQENFEERKAHKRPEPHPTSLHPRLARALVNLVNSREILDPFCGSGGILIEAGLLGLKIKGYDLDRIMLNRAKINLEYYKINNYILKIGDATKIKEKAEAIVTDLPYGRNSKIKDVEKTYLYFLKNSEKITKKMVVVFPSFVDYKKLVEKTKWKIKKEFDHYLHKSLSKKILVLKV